MSTYTDAYLAAGGDPNRLGEFLYGLSSVGNATNNSLTPDQGVALFKQGVPIFGNTGGPSRSMSNFNFSNGAWKLNGSTSPYDYYKDQTMTANDAAASDMWRRKWVGSNVYNNGGGNNNTIQGPATNAPGAGMFNGTPTNGGRGGTGNREIGIGLPGGGGTSIGAPNPNATGQVDPNGGSTTPGPASTTPFNGSMQAFGGSTLYNNPAQPLLQVNNGTTQNTPDSLNPLTLDKILQQKKQSQYAFNPSRAWNAPRTMFNPNQFRVN